MERRGEQQQQQRRKRRKRGERGRERERGRENVFFFPFPVIQNQPPPPLDPAEKEREREGKEAEERPGRKSGGALRGWNRGLERLSQRVFFDVLGPPPPPPRFTFFSLSLPLSLLERTRAVEGKKHRFRGSSPPLPLSLFHLVSPLETRNQTAVFLLTTPWSCPRARRSSRQTSTPSSPASLT